MTKKLLLLLAVPLAAPLTWAAAVTPGCVDGGTLASYVALGSGGCQIGDKIFANFTYQNTVTGGATPVTSSQVTVDTVGPSGQSILGPDLGVQFASAWNALTGQSNDAAITFTVSVVGGGPMQIEDAAVAQVSAVLPNGIATVMESGCGPAPCIPGTWGVMTFNNGGPTSQSMNDTFFSPTGSVQVAKDIDANGGDTEGSSASISIVQDVFSQTAVPEPMSMGLLGGGLAFLGLARARRAAKKS